MKLVSFSVTNYRSITTAYKLPIRQATILIGPNNEGKSNILRALVSALEILRQLGRFPIPRGRFPSFIVERTYNWSKDFPVTLQENNPGGETVFNLEFELTEIEIDQFADEVKSSLNGTLPVKLTLGQKEPSFRILKKGPGAEALTKKVGAIAQFIAKRINIKHIPTVRTAESAQQIVSEMVEKELATLEEDESLKKALAEIARVQAPVLEKISKSIEGTLREFLPNVKKVRVSIPQEERYRALRRSCEIVVDDGTPTELVRKGDGVQSLAALSLMRHASETGATGKNLILAIEEPESHLHPMAIHQLKVVLNEIARKHQVIMTTHCPLFVDRASLKSNILVHNNKAAPAKDVREIREILGVRASDNLRHAELVLLVEGEDDRKSLTALLKHHSPELNSAITQGTLAIDSLLGGSNLSYKLCQARDAVCVTHSFLDHDKCGIEAARAAELDGLITPADTTFTVCNGMKESEIEDIYDENLYANLLQHKYGVSTASPKFKGTAKWSDRLYDTFRNQGKLWSDGVESKVKLDIAELVEANPGTALNIHKRSSFDALIQALKIKIEGIAESKEI